MYGYSVKLPLKYDIEDGPYSMNKNLKEVVAQNFKMLLLTNKGEKIMDTNYGIGLRSMLFHNRGSGYSEIDIEPLIELQVKTYLPFITITNIQISDDIENINSISISIEYQIPSIKESDIINLILS